jgi:hypothetical protein
MVLLYFLLDWILRLILEAAFGIGEQLVLAEATSDGRKMMLRLKPLRRRPEKPQRTKQPAGEVQQEDAKSDSNIQRQAAAAAALAAIQAEEEKKKGSHKETRKVKLSTKNNFVAWFLMAVPGISLR